MISVIIPTFNRKNDLERGIASILKQNYKDFEIIVIDNGPSTDGTKVLMGTLVKRYPNITYVQTTHKGCIFSRNLGARKSRGELLLTVDDDVELLSPNTFDILIETFAERDIGVVGAIELRDPRKKIKPLPDINNIGRITEYGHFDTGFGNLIGRPITDVDHVRSAFMAFRKSIFEEVNGFNEIYNAKGMGFRYETDFCLRIKKLGYRVVVNPKLTVWHKVRPRSRGFERGRGRDFFYYTSRNHTFFMLTHFWKKKKIRYLLFDFFIGTTRNPGIIKFTHKALTDLSLVEMLFLPYLIFGKLAGIKMFYTGPNQKMPGGKNDP